MTFCTDVDLLNWEPHVFVDAAGAGQTLISGSGNLAGTSFTINSGSLATNHVEADEVIVLSGGVAGSFPIVAVNSATNLTISVMYDGLEPDDGSAPEATPVGTYNGAAYVIRTFWAQRKVVSDLLRCSAGVDPDSQEQLATILNPTALKRACVLGTLQMIYNVLAATIPSDNVSPYLERAQVYARLYCHAFSSAKVEIDLDGDGKSDEVRRLSVVRFVRA